MSRATLGRGRSDGAGTTLDEAGDILARHLQGMGLQAVTQVTIDDAWSALRFKPM
jgi:hypothetical protein